MNAHQEQVIRALLDTLIDPLGVDGGLMAEPLLHGATAQNTTPPATLNEFEEALKFCETKKWITGQRGATARLRWAVTDTGRVARRDM